MDIRPEPLCPLCGQPNGCEAARSGRHDMDCWCLHVRIPSEVLDRIPPPLRGQACLCPRCAGVGEPSEARP